MADEMNFLSDLCGREANWANINSTNQFLSDLCGREEY
ncbi:hypothetical protein EJK55_0500 [Moraxella catarrhalis]|uniref:Uncharacterized protein n=1 Tax=Moraxella catarrhalis TaxID=480 RepID=A0ABY0BLI9_MORCA|nr:hypothetical protein EJK55_0499 [Moraxella catarrhalis]RUO12965.1 hypothetical protein EJK55_0500 [Moraxella catarrhalis]RUO16690.1 hypothetical protein EJK54_0479 [Moraxella catarrhalis]